jgi:hypothetical protein
VEPTRYRIAVRGLLTARVASAFEGFALQPGNKRVTATAFQSFLMLRQRIREVRLMSTLLHVSASPRGASSDSRALAGAFLDAHRRAHPDVTVEELDLFDGKLTTSSRP